MKATRAGRANDCNDLKKDDPIASSNHFRKNKNARYGLVDA